MRYELMVGLRYTRARRRNRFIGINSAVSMIGIAVGVWALIVVLSVMNGFQKEVRTRILGVVSHLQIIAEDNRLADWQSVAKLAAQHPRVVATAPFVQAQAMLSNGQAVRGAVVRGILPAEEEKVADLARHMRDAQTLYQMGDAVSGVRLKLDDLFAARAVGHELLAKLPRDMFASDWTRSHANFFRAVEIEKRMMFLILGLIVLVAAINIISTLVMAVTDKQADIAILRTLGAAPGSVLQIFMVQGMVLGVVGTLIGVLTGIVTALNIDVIVPAIERAFSIKFLSKDVYLIPDLPSDLQANDVIWIAAMALGLSFLATIYPSWRAGRVNPAEALRYE